MIKSRYANKKVSAKYYSTVKVEGSKPTKVLTDEEFKECGIRMNKNLGEWDWGMLANNYDVDWLKDVGFDKEIESILAEKKETPEVEFSEELLLEHNYVVLYFDNQLDWQVAVDKFGLKKVKSIAPKGSQRIGIGSVIKGKDIIDKL